MTTPDSSVLVQLEWAQANQLLENAATIVTVTHVKPDGDAIGSLMGLSLALQEMGKTVVPAVDGGCPERFAFIPKSSAIQQDLNGVVPDLVISTDASDRERIGEVGETALENGVDLIQLDHHQTNVLFGNANLVDARTVAAAEGVLDWLQERGHPISKVVAQCLLTGIVTDTLCFRTANVSATTFAKVQTLIEAGANLTEIVQRTMARQSGNQIRLYGQVLSKMKVEDQVVWVTLTAEDYESAGVPRDTYSGLSGYLVQSDEAYIAAEFKELGPGEVECHFRSIPGFDVSKVAFELGGGGHVQASGCTVRGKSLQDVEAMVIPMLKQAARAGNPLYE